MPLLFVPEHAGDGRGPATTYLPQLRLHGGRGARWAYHTATAEREAYRGLQGHHERIHTSGPDAAARGQYPVQECRVP